MKIGEKYQKMIKVDAVKIESDRTYTGWNVMGKMEGKWILLTNFFNDLSYSSACDFANKVVKDKGFIAETYNFYGPVDVDN